MFKIKLLTLSCDSMTPLGFPVVPDCTSSNRNALHDTSK